MRFGVGGGSRLARGGISVGKGGVRGGVGSGPFSLKGGFGGGSGSSGVFESLLILIGIILLSILFALMTLVIFTVIAVSLNLRLLSAVREGREPSAMNRRQMWLFQNRVGILHSNIIIGLLVLMGITFWTSSQDKVDSCRGEIPCAEALSQFHKSVFVAIITCAIGLVALIALVRNLRTILKHRSSWPTERADTNEIYKSFGRWYLSIPSSIKARQWSGLVFAPWHVNVEDHHPE